MNKTDILELAEQYLINRKIDFVKFGAFGSVKGNKQEIIFLDPFLLIVLVNTKNNGKL